MASDGTRSRWLYKRPSRNFVLTCDACRRYHRLLPDDLCAYRDATLDEVETAFVTGPGPTAGAKASAQAGVDGVRRVRRWHRGFATFIHILLGLLTVRSRAAIGPSRTRAG